MVELTWLDSSLGPSACCKNLTLSPLAGRGPSTERPSTFSPSEEKNAVNKCSWPPGLPRDAAGKRGAPSKVDWRREGWWRRRSGETGGEGGEGGEGGLSTSFLVHMRFLFSLRTGTRTGGYSGALRHDFPAELGESSIPSVGRHKKCTGRGVTRPGPCTSAKHAEVGTTHPTAPVFFLA